MGQFFCHIRRDPPCILQNLAVIQSQKAFRLAIQSRIVIGARRSACDSAKIRYCSTRLFSAPIPPRSGSSWQWRHPTCGLRAPSQLVSPMLRLAAVGTGQDHLGRGLAVNGVVHLVLHGGKELLGQRVVLGS